MKVLVANRGEIACRIFTTLREMAVPSVAIYAPEEARAPHVFLADEAHPLPSPAAYLDAACLVRLAKAAGATAIHPGYGFLSQSAAFVEACEAAALCFIGPSAATMRLLGDKAAARTLAAQLDIQVVPGAIACDDLAAFEAAIAQLGLPLLLKAVGGGGGKGMRRVDDAAAAAAAWAAAQREAAGACGDPRLLVEKFIAPARHIEVQIAGDGTHVVALGDRECSLQRRFQKVIEEAPAATLDAPQRAALHGAAVALGRAASYASLGTVEFLLGDDGAWYFLEVNTRLQVEHPVTEATCGIDLVRLQVELAQGGALPSPVAPQGFAIEARLIAEDPAQHFLPSSGDILHLHWPQWPGVRIDNGVACGQTVGVDFDGLLAKVIAWAPSRPAACRKLVAALQELCLLGPTTNQAFLIDTLRSAAFAARQTFTTTLEEHPWTPAAPSPTLAQAAQQLVEKAATPAPAAAPGDGGDRYSPWNEATP